MLTQPKNEPVLGKNPGTNLSLLLQKCRVRVSDGCDCDDWIQQMNAWGVDGCQQHRQEIITRLAEKAQQLSTSKIVYTGLLMMWNGIRPEIGELVDEAIWSASNAISNEGSVPVGTDPLIRSQE